MGCFNAVCNLSGLQIHHRDPIKLIVTLPSRSSLTIRGGLDSSLVSPSDLRIPCFLPVSGKYDDYGCIKDINEDDLTTKLLDSYFREAKVNQWLHYTSQFSDQYEEYGRSKWFKQISTEGFKVSRSPLDTLKNDNDGVYLSYSLILQEVWDEYINIYDCNGEIRTRTGKCLDDWFEWYSELVDKAIANPNNANIAGEYGKNAAMVLGFMGDSGNHNFDLDWFTDLYFDNFLQPLCMAKAFKHEKGQAMWRWFRNNYIEFMIINLLMYKLPRFWMPRMYADQNREYRLQADLATVNHTIAKWRLDNEECE